MKAGAPTTLAGLVSDRRVLVCCGTGGVGKTTIAAALAIEAARRGRRVLVMTVDPSKRLADSLGLDPTVGEPRAIPDAAWDPAGDARAGGTLDGLVLDRTATFDGLIERYATSDEQRDRILTSRFYRNLAGGLSGTQEYMAMEQLHAQHERAVYDLIVVDTPPTRHALDFLDAPARLTRLLDNRAFRLLMLPTRRSWQLTGAAVHQFARRLGRVVGSEVIDDVVAFFRAFDGMESGFRERAAAVRALTADDRTAFVLVASPRPDALAEAEFFAARLTERGLRVGGLVVNRVHPGAGLEPGAGAARSRAWTAVTDPATSDPATSDPAARAAAMAARERLIDYQGLAIREHALAGEMAARFGVPSAATVELLATDVAGFEALQQIARALFHGAGTGEPATSR